jgi:RNA polymerase sigma factor (sigma-70 family)
MSERTDQELLGEYAQQKGEAAFVEMVGRHVDFVYSAAVRMVRDPQMAKDVTQCVFITLAQNAGKLIDRPVLSGWLHRTTQNLAAKAVRTEVRRRQREQEAAIMNSSDLESDSLWQAMAPLLDDGLRELPTKDRDALFLRFFEHKTAGQVADQLGLSEEAAQKRIHRAIERLRAFFVKRGVVISSAGLAAALTKQAIQAAPAGLGAAISAALSGPALVSTELLGITKAIAMTTAQKIMVGTTLTLAVGAGLFQTQQAARRETEKQALLQQQAPLTKQLSQLCQERDRANANLAAVQEQIAQLRRDADEVRSLREEIAALQARTRELTQLKLTNAQRATATTMQSLAQRVGLLKKQLELMPGKNIPELQLVNEQDWLEAAMAAKTDAEDDLRKGLGRLRTLAKDKLAPILARALQQYTKANNGQLPADFAQLKPYFEVPVDDAILARYNLAAASRLSDLKPGQAVVQEKGLVDTYDTLHGISPDRYFRTEMPVTADDGSGTVISSTHTTVQSVPESTVPRGGQSGSGGSR